MQQFIGEEFDAEVSGVQSFGVFVALENGCEGLIRAELMTGDFYQYDEEHMAMVGRHTGKRFTIGTPMRQAACRKRHHRSDRLCTGRRLTSVSEKLDRPRREGHRPCSEQSRSAAVTAAGTRRQARKGKSRPRAKKIRQYRIIEQE